VTSAALVSDIHGNLVALKAVERDLERRPVDLVVCLGDVAAMGPRPNECAEFVRSHDWPMVLGNTEAWLLGELEMPSRILTLDSSAMPFARDIVTWGKSMLSATTARFLRSLPLLFRFELADGVEVLCCHGSPRSFQDRLLATTPPAVVDSMLGGASARIIAAGHTHMPLVRRHADQLIINGGSVGLPFQDSTRDPYGMQLSPSAQYAVVSSCSTGFSVELRETPIDVDELQQDVINSGMPHGRWWFSLW
jgi:predicted phosphodiesterase